MLLPEIRVKKYRLSNRAVLLLQFHRVDDSGDEVESMALSEKSRHQHQNFLHPYRAPLYGSKHTLYTDSANKLPHAYSYHNFPSIVVEGETGTREGQDTVLKPEGSLPPRELMAFIERQEEYIEQLEKESQYCRVCTMEIKMHNTIVLQVVFMAVNLGLLFCGKI